MELPERGRILVVDDHDMNVRILCRILRDRYELETATCGEECLEKMRSFEPDVVLLDIMMPGISGYEVCRQIKSGPCARFIQVMLVSGKASTAERLEGYECGADDYIVKPFDHDELRSRVHIQFRLRESQLQVWELSRQLQDQNKQLETLVRARTAEVIATQDVTVFALAQLADSRDPETGEHLIRLRTISQLLAEELARTGPYTHLIDDKFLRDLYRSSPLHDIGKVGIHDDILRKPGRLTAGEFEAMKQHVLIGAETLERAAGATLEGTFLTMAAQIARYHHERWDGTGYCAGLRNEAIPLCARIVALADVYDALTSKRVYKDAMPAEEARDIIVESAGSHFDPAIVDAFLRRFDTFAQLPQSIPSYFRETGVATVVA